MSFSHFWIRMAMYILLFCKQNYIWLEQPRARCDDMKNHTRNGCKKIANPKSDYVTHEVSGNKCTKLFLSFNCYSYNTKAMWCVMMSMITIVLVHLLKYWQNVINKYLLTFQCVYSGNILASCNVEIMIQFLNWVFTMLGRGGGLAWSSQVNVQFSN